MAQEILSNVDDTNFVEDDWNVVFEKCTPLASKWQQLSAYLGLKMSIIDRIRSDFPNDSLGCLSEALKEWIKMNYDTEKFGRPSWKTLLNAIAKIDQLQFTTLATEHQAVDELYRASGRGDLKKVKELVELNKLDPLQKEGPYGMNALHNSAQFGQLHVLKYFIEKRGCSPASQDNQARTPLNYAALGKHLDIVHYLVTEQRMDPLCYADNGDTPLHVASRAGDINVMKYLVNELSKSLPLKDIVTSRGIDGAAPIHYAAGNGHLEIVKFFIDDLKCDPNNIARPVEYQGRTTGFGGRIALHAAAQGGHLHIIKYLVEQCNCNPSHLDSERVTPLHVAASKGHLEVVQYLTLEQHCDPCVSKNHNTPLHSAALEGHLQLVRFFIEELHCPPDVRGALNLTPLEMAHRQEHHHVVRYLESI